MGYTTEFEGKFSATPSLKQIHIDYLNNFSEIRHMRRDVEILEMYSDPIREAAGLPIGIEGEFFINSFGYCGQDDDPSILDYNNESSTQPGLWCHWVISENGKYLEWDGGEKFYCYVEWLEYIIKNFLNPWGYVLNGSVKFQGEDEEDFGTIECKNNIVKVLRGS